MDGQIGRLRKALRAHGVARDTLVWFTFDNGPVRDGTAPGSTGPLRGGKFDLLEGGIRVPAVVEWPAQVGTGRSSAAPAVTSDVYPTVLAAAGIEIPSDEPRPMDGSSLLGTFTGDEKALSRRIAFHSNDQQALIGPRYKLYRPRPEADASGGRARRRAPRAAPGGRAPRRPTARGAAGSPNAERARQGRRNR